MKASEAWDIHSRYRLIGRSLSKIVLRKVALNQPIKIQQVAEKISAEEIENLREMYSITKEKMSLNGNQNKNKKMPRNIIFYKILEDQNNFSWRMSSIVTEQGHRVIHLNVPLIEGLRPSLLSLLLDRIAKSKMSSRASGAYRSLHRLPAKKVDIILELIEKAGFVRPKPPVMDSFVAAIERAYKGTKLNIVTPLCPDYEAESIGGGMYRYTFDKLGKGIGIVGQRYLAALPSIAKKMEEIGIFPNFIASFGDFESFSETNCKRVGVTEREFCDRLKESCTSIVKSAPVPIEVMLFTNICGGKKRWIDDHTEIQTAFLDGNFGKTGLGYDAIKKICESRRYLYQRWFGPLSFEEQLAVLISQGAEYGAMGRNIGEFFTNPIVIGADHARMAPFYSFDEVLPTLYLKSNYKGVN